MLESYLEVSGVNIDFSEALKQFVNIAKNLQDPEMLEQEHGRVESMLNTQGIELLRLMFQAHLDCRTNSEE
jgi:ribosome-associated translation inhibitor RaiA